MKKGLGKILLFGAALVMGLAVADGGMSQVNAASKVKLSTGRVCLYVGNTKTLTVKNKPSGAKCKWSSSKKKVATVSGKGVVKGVKAGTAVVSCKVTASKNTYNLKSRIIVSKKDKTGYKPSRFTWQKDGTDGYSMPHFTSGKYVRADGKAVMYINFWDTGESFMYTLYAKSPSKKLYDCEFEYEQVWLSSPTKAFDTVNWTTFVDKGDNVIIVQPEWKQGQLDIMTSPAGKYYLVREK